MDVTAWRRRRRIALATGTTIVLAVVGAYVAIWVLAPEWRSSYLVVWPIIAAPGLVLMARHRPRRLRARLQAVEAAIDVDETAMLMGVQERQATWWLGTRGWITPFLVLVDDPVGYALWDVRRGQPIEVMRCSWTHVADAVVREGGAYVDLDPAVSGDPTMRLVPTAFRDEPPQLRQTPSRALEFAARIRDRLHSFDPEAHPRPPRPSGDVDWTGLSKA